MHFFSFPYEYAVSTGDGVRSILLRGNEKNRWVLFVSYEHALAAGKTRKMPFRSIDVMQEEMTRLLRMNARERDGAWMDFSVIG